MLALLEMPNLAIFFLIAFDLWDLNQLKISKISLTVTEI
jgi:hypothetical protein